ncbi:MFS transporter [Microbacterium oxydans]|nr:MFS transporter [Microbacterium oxydans]
MSAASCTSSCASADCPNRSSTCACSRSPASAPRSPASSSPAGVSSASVLLVSLHLQDTRGWTAAEAGLAILPQAAAIAIGGVIAPIALRWLRTETLTVGALLLQAVGMLWLFTDPEIVAAPLVLVGLGFGIGATLAATALFDVTVEDDAGQVGAIQEVGFALGGGLGIAVLGTIAVVATGGFGTAALAAAIVVVASAVVPLLRRRVPRPSNS